MPCFSLLISVKRRSKLSQRSRVSLNLAFMLFIWKDCVRRTKRIVDECDIRKTTHLKPVLNTASYLLGCFLLQVNNLILPVNPLRLQLTCQQVRVLQTWTIHQNASVLIKWKKQQTREMLTSSWSASIFSAWQVSPSHSYCTIFPSVLLATRRCT